MVSRLKHENFVELQGYCVEGNMRVLAYEFATMGSLHDILHGIYHLSSYNYYLLEFNLSFLIIYLNLTI